VDKADIYSKTKTGHFWSKSWVYSNDLAWS